MATTVTAPVSNDFTLASRYLPILDEVYQRGALTSVLDTASERVRWAGAKTANLFKINMVGLGNYNRNAGFVPGDVNGAWEPFTIKIDRGRSYMVDVMDNDETIGMAFGALVGETMRTQVVPEVDAYRFAKYAGVTGISKADPTAISSSVDVAKMIDQAEATMGDNEVPEDGRILFVSEKGYQQLKNNITRYVSNDERGINRQIESYDGMRIVKVPSKRFYTGCQLLNPNNSDEFGGFLNIGAPINFMIVHPSAILQVVKHVIPRIFSPQVNQEADAWKFDYRIYHDCWAQENKVDGIYLSAAPAMTVSATTATVAASSTTTVTLTGATGTVTVTTTDSTVATAAESSGTVTITGVAAGTARIGLTDGNGSKVYVTVTVTAA